MPVAISTILTSGFAAAGDGGGATFVRAAGPFGDGASFQSLDGAWWQLSVPVINPAQFGARGDGVTDDTAALQNAINFAKNIGCAMQLFAQTYLHTSSLNWGKANPFDGKNLKVFGSALGHTRFVAAMTEAYPAHDFTNQIGGTIEHITFTSTSGSQHTVLMLFAETVGTGMNQFNMSDCLVQDLSDVSKYAIFGLTADQFMFEKCSVLAAGAGTLGAVYFSINNPAAIVSKFYAIVASNADVTVFQAYFSAFGCSNGPALWTQAYSNVNLFSVYAGIQGVGGHTKGIFRFGGSLVGGYGRETSINMLGCRSEDNGQLFASPLAVATASIAPGADSATSVMTVSATSAGAIAVGQLLSGSGVAGGTTVLAKLTATTWQVSQIQTVASTTISSGYLASPAIFIEDYIIESYFQCTLGSFGGAFGGPGSHTNSEVKAAISYGAFSNAGTLTGGKFHFSAGNNSLGNFDFVGSSQYTLGGRVGAGYPALYAAAGPTAGGFDDLHIDVPGYGFQRRVSATTTLIFGDATPNSAINFRIKPSGETGVANVAAYTGGSGLQTIFAPSFNPSYLTFESAGTASLCPVNADTVLTGTFNAAWAAGGEMKVVMNQTVAGVARTATLIDLAGIPAQSASAGWKLTVKMIGGGNWFAISTLEIFGSAPISAIQQFNLGSQGFSATAGTDFTLDVQVSNSGSNPLGAAVFFAVG